MKIYSACWAHGHPLDTMDIFDPETEAVNHPSELKEQGILILHGGADISPKLYNKGRSRRTHAGTEPSHRDQIEWDLAKEAVKLGMPIFGICRGAQLLCALAGGFLIQDVTNHAGAGHMVKTREGNRFYTNSIHHQMQQPKDTVHELLAWTEKPISNHYLDVDEEVEMTVEPEFVYYPEQRGIAIQWHPEAMGSETPANLYVKDFVRNVCRSAYNT